MKQVGLLIDLLTRVNKPKGAASVQFPEVTSSLAYNTSFVYFPWSKIDLCEEKVAHKFVAL